MTTIQPVGTKQEKTNALHENLHLASTVSAIALNILYLQYHPCPQLFSKSGLAILTLDIVYIALSSIYLIKTNIANTFNIPRFIPPIKEQSLSSLTAQSPVNTKIEADKKDSELPSVFDQFDTNVLIQKVLQSFYSKSSQVIDTEEIALFAKTNLFADINVAYNIAKQSFEQSHKTTKIKYTLVQNILLSILRKKKLVVNQLIEEIKRFLINNNSAKILKSKKQYFIKKYSKDEMQLAKQTALELLATPKKELEQKQIILPRNFRFVHSILRELLKDFN